MHIKGLKEIFDELENLSSSLHIIYGLSFVVFPEEWTWLFGLAILLVNDIENWCSDLGSYFCQGAVSL